LELFFLNPVNKVESPAITEAKTYFYSNHLISSLFKLSIYHHSETLLGNLASKRINELEKETLIIFNAHSLGGIIVKDALQLSAKENSHLKEIAAATTGVMFLGTPHHGFKAASLRKLAFRIV
jgi:hypothetical protein